MWFGSLNIFDFLPTLFEAKENFQPLWILCKFTLKVNFAFPPIFTFPFVNDSFYFTIFPFLLGWIFLMLLFDFHSSFCFLLSFISSLVMKLLALFLENSTMMLDEEKNFKVPGGIINLIRLKLFTFGVIVNNLTVFFVGNKNNSSNYSAVFMIIYFDNRWRKENY